MKKLSLKKTTLRHLTADQLEGARGGLVTTDGGQTLSCADTCGCPVGAPPAPSGRWSCARSCVLCGPF